MTPVKPTLCNLSKERMTDESFGNSILCNKNKRVEHEKTDKARNRT